MSRSAPCRRVLALVLIDTLLVFAAIETVPRFVDLPHLTRADLDPPQVRGLERRARPHPELGLVLEPNWSTPEGAHKQASHNSLGFRGPEVKVPKPAGRFRVLCLGGATTYGTGPTADERTYPARLQAHLSQTGVRRVEVLNLGCPGWTSRESAIHLARSGGVLEPDLVLVYHGYEDSHAALWPDPDWDAAWSGATGSSSARLLDESWTYLLWRAYLTDRLDRCLNLPVLSVVGGREIPAAFDLDHRLPAHGLVAFRRNLRELVASSGGLDAEIVFVTQAFNPAEGVGDDPYGGEVRLRALRAMTEVARQVALEGPAYCIDAAPVLEEEARAWEAGTGAINVFLGNVHLRNAGANLLAQTIAEGLVEQGLVPAR